MMGRKKPTVHSDLSTYKYVRLQLPPEWHQTLRIEAAKQNTDMSTLARMLVIESLTKLKKAGK
jgi:hypothetical protein